MKLYILQTMVVDDEGNFTITFHKRIYLEKLHAFDAAIVQGKDTVVLEMVNTNSWNHEAITHLDAMACK